MLLELSPRKKIHLITLIDLVAIVGLVMIFPWDESWVLPSFRIALFWAAFSVAVSFSTTTLPLGRAVASVGDLVDVAGIAIAGPFPIIVANIFALSVNAFKEGGSRLHKLPFNLVLWILAPMLSALIYYLVRPTSEGELSVTLCLAIICTFIVYSFLQLSHVSVAIAISEGIPFLKVLRKNYYYTEIASLATIPISITMVVIWYYQGMLGVALLAAPLLLVSVGLRVAFERGKLHEKIKREQQLAELGKSAASILHEVEKPITRIAMEAEFAITDREKPKEHFSRILEWAKEAGGVTRDLLSALAGQIQPQDVKPNAIIEDVLRRFPPEERNRIILNCDLPIRLTASWDRNGIELVVTNLLMNALEADPAGKVNIDIQSQMKRRLLHKYPDSVNIKISDRGPGLPQVSLEKLFDPLFSTKSSGRGIGLFICRQVAIAHGGSLLAQDRYPHGAEFVLSLPIHPHHSDAI